jgi:lysine/ornithine N-monooxygenase
MNNENVERIKIELEKLSNIDKISSMKNKLFTVDYLEYEYHKIVSAKEKNNSTHKSEYRVIKTLIRQRNQMLYELRDCPDILKNLFLFLCN